MKREPVQALLINDLQVDEALQRVSASSRLPYSVPAIICSVPGVEQAAGALGAEDYLVKPISRKMLLETLERVTPDAKTVLIVDDEADALQLFGRMLAAAERGYRVLRAYNGRQALQIIRQERPDVMLVDLMMPEMDGLQLLAAKNQDATCRDIPVILISARDPFGQPIVSNALAVTCQGGLSVEQILASIEALTAILAKAVPPADPAPPENPDGSPACE
jgi:CheY-like chemotaxis protein